MRSPIWHGRVVAGAIAGVLLAAPLAADAAVFSCDEPGVQTAAATGGGPHTFSCAGPTTAIVSNTIPIFASVILDGGGALTVSGGNGVRVFSVVAGSVELRDLQVTAGFSSGQPGGCILVASGASLTLVDVTVSGCTTVLGTATNVGGAIANNGTLTLTDCVVSGSTGSIGGGISSGNTSPAATLNLTRSRVTGNTPTFLVGGVSASGNLSITDSTISGNGHFGLSVGGTAGTTQSVTSSTISGNTGGGIAHSATTPLAISNSSVAQNGGPGIQNANGVVVLTNSTLAGNGGAPSPTAIFHFGSGTETLLDTIVAGTCTPGGRTSQGGNLESPGSTCGLIHASDLVNVSAIALNLGALGNHGGPTQSVPLLAPSVAIDSAVSCPPPTVDQRGVVRPQGASCDRGAFELGIAVVPALADEGMTALAMALVVAGILALRFTRRSGCVSAD